MPYNLHSNDKQIEYKIHLKFKAFGKWFHILSEEMNWRNQLFEGFDELTTISIYYIMNCLFEAIY